MQRDALIWEYIGRESFAINEEGGVEEEEEDVMIPGQDVVSPTLSAIEINTQRTLVPSTYKNEVDNNNGL